MIQLHLTTLLKIADVFFIKYIINHEKKQVITLSNLPKLFRLKIGDRVKIYPGDKTPIVAQVIGVETGTTCNEGLNWKSCGFTVDKPIPDKSRETWYLEVNERIIL
jgi:signal peptidase I